MKPSIWCLVLLLLFPLTAVQAESDAVTKLLQGYAAQGVGMANGHQVKQLWQITFAGKVEFPERSCTSCHTADLSLPGKHIKTQRAIKPMAPFVNPERLTDSKTIEKWFKRNCKWTLGRECTPQEKANLLLYIDTHINYQE